MTLPFNQGDEQRTIFLTVCTKAKKPILASPEVHKLIVATWQNPSGWLVGNYLLMPDHVHLFCAPNGGHSLQAWISFWKIEIRSNLAISETTANLATMLLGHKDSYR